MVGFQKKKWDSFNVEKLNENDFQQSKIDSFEARLKNTIIPLCRNNNNVKFHLEHMLEQRLHFPIHLAEPYSLLLLLN